MASDTPNEEDQAGESHEPRECMPCRGTGRVISNLGGTPSQVECPWCGGAGTRVAGIDAQARWPTEAETAAQAAGGAASAGGSSAPDAEPDQAA
ncbi:MAG TPA: hypothetical protein VII01_15255 [Solirubrobacteraceae bacterium]